METKRCRVLLVDDREANFRQIRDIFVEAQPKACELGWIRSYELGILSIRVDEWNLILVNQQVGQQHTGLEFIHHARLWNSSLPFILVSDDEDARLDYKARKIGAIDCVARESLTPAYLREMIGERADNNISYSHPSGKIAQGLGRLF